VWIVGEGLAGTVGYLRMAAGYHYPTDVLVGAGVGTSIGLLVPWLHDSPAEPASNAEPSEGGRPSLLVTPALGPGTAGLWVTVF
jgi:membrane-associated phospholipid phosphatase